MALSWHPIHPSKSPLLRAKPAAVEYNEIATYSGLTVSCYHFGLDVMLDLEFPFGQTKGKANVQYFVLEMAAYTPGVHHAEIIDGRLFFVRKGAGFRLGVASWDVEFTAAANLAAVAASGSVKTAKTNLYVQTFGGDAIKSLKIFDKIQTYGALSPEALRDIAIAGAEVSDVFSSDPNLTPTDMLVANVDVGVTEGWQEVAFSLQFAAESIYRKKSVLTALADFTKKDDKEQRKLLNSLIPRAGYTEFGILNEAQVPNQDQSDRALRILTLGR